MPSRLSFSPGFAIAMLLIAIGVVGGVVCDVSPERPVVHRAGYRVLEADFHTHTAWSDGSLSPLGVMRQAQRRGLDVVAVTEHNTVWPSRFARAYASGTSLPLAITGEEVTTFRFHVIALGIEETVSPDQSLDGVIDAIHTQGGVAVLAHPVRHYWANVLPFRARFDAAEVMHPIAYSERYGDWRWQDMVTFWEEAKPPIGAIGSSDYHWMSLLGVCRTLVFVNEPVTERAVIEAVRAHHTVTFDRAGHAYGDPVLVEELRKEPYTPRTSDYGYQGSSTLDRVLRIIGFLGLVGVILLRAARLSGSPPSPQP